MEASVSKTPYELWTERVPSLNHLRVCGGALLRLKYLNPNIGKLVPKTVSCHFIGYPEKSKGFRFYYPKRYKVCRNETRCLPRGWIDEGKHGSSRNWPWREAGVCAHSNDLWAFFHYMLSLYQQYKILWCQHLLLFRLWQQWMMMRNLSFRIL